MGKGHRLKKVPNIFFMFFWRSLGTRGMTRFGSDFFIINVFDVLFRMVYSAQRRTWQGDTQWKMVFLLSNRKILLKCFNWNQNLISFIIYYEFDKRYKTWKNQILYFERQTNNIYFWNLWSFPLKIILLIIKIKSLNILLKLY
jgi:hypothetical protein